MSAWLLSAATFMPPFLGRIAAGLELTLSSLLFRMDHALGSGDTGNGVVAEIRSRLARSALIDSRQRRSGNAARS